MVKFRVFAISDETRGRVKQTVFIASSRAEAEALSKEARGLGSIGIERIPEGEPEFVTKVVGPPPKGRPTTRTPEEQRRVREKDIRLKEISKQRLRGEITPEEAIRLREDPSLSRGTVKALRETKVTRLREGARVKGEPEVITRTQIEKEKAAAVKAKSLRLATKIRERAGVIPTAIAVSPEVLEQEKFTSTGLSSEAPEGLRTTRRIPFLLSESKKAGKQLIESIGTFPVRVASEFVIGLKDRPVGKIRTGLEEIRTDVLPSGEVVEKERKRVTIGKDVLFPTIPETIGKVVRGAGLFVGGVVKAGKAGVQLVSSKESRKAIVGTTLAIGKQIKEKPKETLQVGAFGAAIGTIGVVKGTAEALAREPLVTAGESLAFGKGLQIGGKAIKGTVGAVKKTVQQKVLEAELKKTGTFGDALGGGKRLKGGLIVPEPKPTGPFGVTRAKILKATAKEVESKELSLLIAGKELKGVKVTGAVTGTGAVVRRTPIFERFLEEPSKLRQARDVRAQFDVTLAQVPKAKEPITKPRTQIGVTTPAVPRKVKPSRREAVLTSIEGTQFLTGRQARQFAVPLTEKILFEPKIREKFVGKALFEPVELARTRQIIPIGKPRKAKPTRKRLPLQQIPERPTIKVTPEGIGIVPEPIAPLNIRSLRKTLRVDVSPRDIREIQLPKKLPRRGKGVGRKESVFGELGPPKTIIRFDTDIVTRRKVGEKVRRPIAEITPERIKIGELGKDVFEKRRPLKKILETTRVDVKSFGKLGTDIDIKGLEALTFRELGVAGKVLRIRKARRKVLAERPPIVKGQPPSVIVRALGKQKPTPLETQARLKAILEFEKRKGVLKFPIEKGFRIVDVPRGKELFRAERGKRDVVKEFRQLKQAENLAKKSKAKQSQFKFKETPTQATQRKRLVAEAEKQRKKRRRVESQTQQVAVGEQILVEPEQIIRGATPIRPGIEAEAKAISTQRIGTPSAPFGRGKAASATGQPRKGIFIIEGLKLKSVSKARIKPIFTVLPKTQLQQQQTPIQQVAPISASIVGQKPLAAQRQVVGQQPIVDQLITPDQRVITGQGIIPIQKVTPTQPPPSPVLDLIIPTPPPGKQPPPRPPPRKLPIRFKFGRGPLEPKQSFNVQVRRGERRGDKFKTVARNLPRNKALRFGANAVDNFVEASFRLKKTKSTTQLPDSPPPNLNKFRRPRGRTKLPKDTFVEKRTFRIDTIGESRGLSFFKRRKQALI